MLILLDYIEKIILDLDSGIKKRSLRKTKVAYEKLIELSNYLKELLPKDFIEENFRDFNRHMRFISIFLRKKDFEWIRNNFEDIRKEDFPAIRKKIYDLPREETTYKKGIVSLSDKVFIVHGRNHKPMKELKAMLSDFDLDPIVLHEQPSGSRTVVEKLEKYSDVGYAFVILTPDDVGCLKKRYLNLYHICLSKSGEMENKHRENAEFFFHNVPAMLINRARQNVILEFGFFMGILGRDRVCCLYSEGVELPSDIRGIVYVPFKKSVHDAREMIIRELRAAGYEISV